jgi:hypothetical protein
MTVLPAQFDGVVTDTTDPHENRAWRSDEAALCAMALAHSARTVATQILLFVFTPMTIVPGDPHDTAGFDMIDFGGDRACHEIASDKPVFLGITSAVQTELVKVLDQNSTKPSPRAVMKPIR